MWRRYKLRINADEEQGLRGHRHVDDVTSPCERSKTEQTSEMVIQGAIDATKVSRGKSSEHQRLNYRYAHRH